MGAETHAADIVSAIKAAFPTDDNPSPAQVEEVMRPFAPISNATEDAIDRLLYKNGRGSLGLRIGPWMEANFVVAGSGPELERRIKFLMGDTCTCVLEHLPKAIEHAAGITVDARILALLEVKKE